MKAVSLMRMGDLETDLTERFPNVDFVFTTEFLVSIHKINKT